jgi:hypothetical protein
VRRSRRSPNGFRSSATLEDILLHRPFYPARPGAAKQVRLVRGLGLASAADLDDAMSPLP